MLAAVLTALVLLVGCAVSGGLAAVLMAHEVEGASQQLDRRSDLAVGAVEAEAGRYVDTVSTVAAAMGAVQTLTAASFQHVVAPLRTMTLAGATAISFVAPASDGEVAGLQSYWRAHGDPGITLRPHGTGREHLFSVLTTALDGSVLPIRGTDASQAAAPTAALAESRRSGQVTISDAYLLLRDRSLPVARRQLSFVLTAPVYAPGTGRFRGWAVMPVRGQNFTGATLGRLAQGVLDVELRATGDHGQPVTVAAFHAAPGGQRDLRRTRAVTVANRQWQVQIAARAANLPGARTALPAVVAAGGTALSLLTASLVYLLATSRSRARAAVRVATAGLRAAEAEASRQAGLLGAVMTSISDGVGVVDADGDFLLHNPAAQAMLGITEDRGGPENWQEHYGLFRPDGVTPFPADELPLARALRGESTEQVDMVIRNAGRPDGMLITVSGRPLDPSAGQPGAVAVFHDVTALRNQEAELRAFAGVAAHDLKSPLAAVAGFTELLQDDLQERFGDELGPQASHYLTRMTGGLDRMQRLIDDLLTYAATRDRTLHTEPVDLQALAATVVTERTAHLRGGSAAEPFPDIYTGPLPVVHADAAMMHQLLDNLVGNALKYTLPGQGARIDISAHARPGDSHVRIEVADRGIGIPAGEHDRIFESFHRAHSAGPAGTGLGLAICQRIVGRHGGSISVSDNPGGGTRVHVTLPRGGTGSARPAQGMSAQLRTAEPH